MASVIQTAAPLVCAGSMGGMMWWMMRGMRRNSSNTQAAEPMTAQLAQLQDENQQLRERVDQIDPQGNQPTADDTSFPSLWRGGRAE